MIMNATNDVIEELKANAMAGNVLYFLALRLHSKGMREITVNRVSIAARRKCLVHVSAKKEPLSE